MTVAKTPRRPSCIVCLIFALAALSSAAQAKAPFRLDTAALSEQLSPTPPPRYVVTDFSAYRQWLSSEIVDKKLPGVAMAIVSSESVLDVETWGVRRQGEPDPVDEHTIFRIASVSKTFAGAVAALMVHSNEQDWDTPIINILPQYHIGTEPSSRNITLRHVLSHSTGLMPHAYSNMLDAGVAYDKIQEKFHEIPTVCSPGRCYGYQNVVFSLLADVVTATTDDSYQHYVQQHIFAPLGMETASVGLAGYESNPDSSAPHQFARGSWHVSRNNPAYYSVAPAAGVNASIQDMARWVQANLGAFPAVLPADVLAQQQTPVIETPRGNYFNRWPRLEKAWYGLGWRVFDYAGKRVIHHGGGVRGYRTELVLVPELDIGMVVMFNAETPVANDAVPAFLDTILQ